MKGDRKSIKAAIVELQFEFENYPFSFFCLFSQFLIPTLCKTHRKCYLESKNNYPLVVEMIDRFQYTTSLLLNKFYPSFYRVLSGIRKLNRGSFYNNNSSQLNFPFQSMPNIQCNARLTSANNLFEIAAPQGKLKN